MLDDDKININTPFDYSNHNDHSIARSAHSLDYTDAHNSSFNYTF